MKDSKEKVLCFRTAGDWTGDDVIKLVSSVNQMYNVFYSYRVVRNILREQENEYMRWLEKSVYFFYKYLDHPTYEEFYYMWRRMLKDWIKYGHKVPFMIPGFPFQLPMPITGIHIPPPSEIFKEIDLYQNEKEKLIIDRIHIASPGGFSFTGIGEIVQQIRELIKDIWFRNNQEKTKGDLEIIEKYLKLQQEYPEYNIPPITSITVDRNMIRKLKSSIEQLRALENEKKLLSVGKHINERPE